MGIKFDKTKKLTFDTPRESVKFELAEREGKLPLLTGYAIVWNQVSSDRGGYAVRFAKGSAKTADDNTFALCNHDYAQVMGCAGNGTLKMTTDDYGMKVTIDPADTSYNRDMIALVRRGDVKGMSFGMLWENQSYTESVQDGNSILDYTEFQFDEVTVTAIPAFEGTSIASEFNKSAEPVKTPLRDAAAVKLLQEKLEAVK